MAFKKTFYIQKICFLIVVHPLMHTFLLHTLTSEIFPFHPYSYCEFTDIQLHSGMGRTPLNQTGENLNFTGKRSLL